MSPDDQAVAHRIQRAIDVGGRLLPVQVEGLGQFCAGTADDGTRQCVYQLADAADAFVLDHAEAS